MDDVINLSSNEFHERLTQYLYSPMGAKFRHQFKFENFTDLICGTVSPKVIVSLVPFFHMIQIDAKINDTIAILDVRLDVPT